MKKIRSRASFVLLISLLVIAGLALFVKNEFTEGRGWALYFSIYNSGSEGEIFDRNGKTLAAFNGAKSTFSSDRLTRTANYHVTGDYWGRTGTGVLSRFWSNSQDYDFIHGTTESSASTLDLTVDSDLNTYAYSLLRANGTGAVMISNYRTGEILCLVSSPAVDPIDNDAEPEEGAYINRCISATFTPGSTFKLITAAAAIENIPNLDELRFTCEKEYDIAGVTITCTGYHGTQTFEEALANSCNCAFAQITVMLGQQTMIKYVDKYGFLSPHDINDIPTLAGTYPLEFVGDPELAWSGIGQSVDQICPFTMLRYVSAIANGGDLVTPTLVKTEEEPDAVPLVNPDTAKRMAALMRNNVVSHYEGEVNFPGLELAAKTGTAEIGGDLAHSWFTGFLLDEEHPYAFVAIVEKGGYGLWTAGLMMNEILQYAVKR